MPRKPPPDDPREDDDVAGEAYNRHRDRVGRRQREQAETARDIKSIPAIVDAARRAACECDLGLDLQTYYPETFALGWSPDHREFIADVENVILNGGRKAIAMPRGSGKTSILVRAANWALKYGHRSFLALIASEKTAAEELADQLRAEWETNDLLLADFPEIAYPIRRLEGINQRANAQTYAGNRTHISWTGLTLAFPTIPGAAGSGAMIRCAGLLGRIRGMAVVHPASGATLRPDVFLCDDFQTDSSAASELECAKRERTINGAVIGFAGPGKSIAGLASSTIIRKGDAADRILNRTLYPRWKGTRCKLVYRWPTSKAADAHWKRYLEVRAEELAAGNERHPRATAYYRQHRAAMDAGARIAWPDRRLPHELSALAHAYGLRADNPDTFDAEYQNDPKPDVTEATDLRVLTSDEFVLKQGAFGRGEVPTDAVGLYAGIDVQQTSLWWVVVAIAADFSGWVVDRGVWPEQPGLGSYFTNDQIERTMQRDTGIPQTEAALLESLERLTSYLFSRRWGSDDGATARLDRCLIDQGYLGKVVNDFCRGSSLAVLPALGNAVTAKNKAWDTIRRQRGERRGVGWRMPSARKTGAVRHVLIDTNDWQTRLCHRWAQPTGGSGSWHLYKSGPASHRMLADNLSSEFPIATEGQGRRLYEWQCRPGRDNHWSDALRMAGVAGAMSGIKVPGASVAPRSAKAASAAAGSTAAKNRVPAGKPAARRPSAAATGKPIVRPAAGDAESGGSGRKSIRELKAAAEARRRAA